MLLCNLTNPNKVNIVIDIGNTIAKLALFRGTELLEMVHDSNETLAQLPELCRRYAIRRGILSTVKELTSEVEQRLSELPFPLLRLNGSTPLPIRIGYRTPQTLGTDRIAAVVGAQAIHPQRNVLVIDAGTCITYEFLDAQGTYQGGNISPGMQMRLKALHQFTSRLPEVSSEGEVPEMGYDTDTAIRAGVIQGIRAEMSGYISRFLKKYPDLFVFLTGGDNFSFDTNLKNIIFADRFLVLKGLNRILDYNDKS